MSLVVRTTRVSDARALARVESEAWRDAYAALLPEDYLVRTLDVDRRTAVWRQRLTHRNEGRLVIAGGGAAGRIVGYAAFGRCRVGSLPFGGELYELYLLPEHQGQGLGRRLCAAVAGHLLESGHSSMCVEVLERNPSRYFYETLGGRLVGRKNHRFGGRSLPALIYGWDDLTALVGEGTRWLP